MSKDGYNAHARGRRYYLEAINDLANAVYENAVAKGWYEEDVVRPFDGQIANIHGECSEALEEWRRGKDFNETYWTIKDDARLPGDEPLVPRVLKVYADGTLYVRNEDYEPDQPPHRRRGREWIPMTPELLRRMPNMVRHLKPEGIPSELADIIIRVLDTAARNGIDIAAAIADKMAYNETRPYRHGGKRS